LAGLGHVSAEGEDHLPAARGQSDEERDRGEQENECTAAPAKTTTLASRKSEPRDDGGDEVTERHDERESGGVTGLDQH